MTKKFEIVAPIIVLIVLVLWLAAGAIADTTTGSFDIVNMQWKIIVGLLGLIQVLIGFIYISGITSVKHSISKLFDQMDKKLDVEIHEKLCLRKDKR